MRFHLDLETYSEANLKKVGLDVYARHPSTEVLMAAWSTDQMSVLQTDEEHHFLRAIREAAANPSIIFHAFNAPFERTILREVAGINIPIERWRCTMVHAYSVGFTGGLDAVGEQIGLPADKVKLREGKRLLDKFSKPAPSNHKADRYTKQNASKDWKKFCAYNTQDVVAEREIALWLEPYPVSQAEWELWFTDQRINDRGLPIDRTLVDRALKVYRAEQKRLKELLITLTGVQNPNSGPQISRWLENQGFPMPNLQAETVTKALQTPPWDGGPSATVARVLELKQQLARKAGSKWETFLRATDWDSGRLRHAFQHLGASRTGRWAGRGIQPQNLHRSPPDQDERVRNML